MGSVGLGMEAQHVASNQIGLIWMVGTFGSLDGVIAWAIRHQSTNLYGYLPAYRDVLTPNISPEPRPEPHSAMAEWGPDDYRVVSSTVLRDVRRLAGADWPILVLAYNSYCSSERLRAANDIYASQASHMPRNYWIACACLWRITSRVRSRMLRLLAGDVAPSTERNWRGSITSALERALEGALDKISGHI